MPINRNALLRYRVIDECLRNRYRRWTLDDLVEACSEALYEYEGIDKGVSKRTVQLDIQMMRSDKLGYEAPIVVVDKKYYTYDDPNYSITNIPLSEQDLLRLQEVVQILKQFRGFKHFEDLSEMTQRLEDKVRSSQTKQPEIISFEKNEQLKGLNFLEPLYQYILQKQSIELTYQSFRSSNSQVLIFSPYLLKEYRNRWFLLGKVLEKKEMSLLALDRMIAIDKSVEQFENNSEDIIQGYFDNVIGVTASPHQGTEEVELFINKQNAPYVQTKPLHHSQEVLEELPYGIIIKLDVQLNFELEREILGFGEAAKVLKPIKLKQRIYQRQQQAVSHYDIDIAEGVMKGLIKRWQHKGLAHFQQVYTQRNIVHLLKLIYQHQYQNNLEATEQISELTKNVASTSASIFQQNVNRLLKQVAPQARLLHSTFCTDFAQNWQPKTSIELLSGADYLLCICLSKSNTLRGQLEYYPGSSYTQLEGEKLDILLESSLPETLSFASADVFLLKPDLVWRLKESRNFSFIYLAMAKA